MLGDNGAGKSTLMKVITGYHRPSSGVMRVFGEERQLASPAEARGLGIETVYQDLALIDELSVWRNFFLGKEMRGGVWPLRRLRRAEMRRITERELENIGIRLVRSADQRVVGLSGGERQSLAIIRAVHFGARVLLLDEPTAALSVRETSRVFAAIKATKSAGHAVLYVDHNVNRSTPSWNASSLSNGAASSPMCRKSEEISVQELMNTLGGVEPSPESDQPEMEVPRS